MSMVNLALCIILREGGWSHLSQLRLPSLPLSLTQQQSGRCPCLCHGHSPVKGLGMKSEHKY